MSEEAKIEVPEAARATYARRRGDDLRKCEAALLAGDFGAIGSVGHKMKGNGSTFGYPELSALGKEMEDASQAGDREKVSDCLRAFSDWVAKHSAP